MAAILSSLVICVGLFVVVCDGQSIGVANNIYDSLQPLGCSQFLAILNRCSLLMRERYMRENMWTLFAPNDTAFARLPPDRRNELLTMTQEDSENYVLAFTLPKALRTTEFNENQPEQSRSPLNTRLFFNKRRRREGNSASGVAGPTEYYANGAMILRPNIPAGNSIIHVIDRVLEVPSDKSALGYISLSSQSDTSFYNEVLSYITLQGDYTRTVEPLNLDPRITVFVPTREAIGRIPKEKLDILRNNPARLNEVAQMHIIESQVVYTSFVYHNEGINSMGRGQIIFRTSTAREAVFVSSGGVTAQVVRGNVTVRNGAVHFVDALLGYKYNTAKDEIVLNPNTRTFTQLLERARNELEQAIVAPSGVTLFVPTDKAFQNVPSYNNIMTNISLINKVIELSMVEPGLEIDLTRVNGEYEARLTLTSRYFRNPIQVYSQGNETWIESGYVKARVIRPDVGVINGYIHIIDAVPGVPSRDVPNTIFCEDWLIKSSLQLAVTGLNDYMRDTRLSNIAPCTTSSGVQSSANVYTAFTNPAFPVKTQQDSSQGGTSQGQPCGRDCFFTVFIPNGTAIDNFENMVAGKQIQSNNQRWQYVLMRHITRQRIYLDQTALGVERTFTALNGDQVRYRRATDRYAYLYYKGRQSRVIHSDLGGTNGVIHIIDAVIFTTDDLTRTDFSSSSVVPLSATTTTATTGAPRAEHHDVLCGPTSISFKIPLPALVADNQTAPQTMTLSDPRCRVDVVNSRLTGSTSLNDCGTTLEVTNDSLVFSNAILLPTVNDTGVTGLIPIQCRYDRLANLTVSAYLPVVRQVLFTETGVGQLSFRINQYRDATFSSRVADSAYPLRLHSSDDVFVELALGGEQQLEGLGMDVVGCMALPSSSPAAADAGGVYENLIENNCPASSEVGLLNDHLPAASQNHSLFRFTFKALTFPDPADPQRSRTGVVYIHCRVKLCKSSECRSGGQCPASYAPSRSKRAVGGLAEGSAGHQLSTGPLLVDGDSSESNASSPLVIFLGVVAACATLVAMVATVAWRRSRRTGDLQRLDKVTADLQ